MCARTPQACAEKIEDHYRIFLRKNETCFHDYYVDFDEEELVDLGYPDWLAARIAPMSIVFKRYKAEEALEEDLGYAALGRFPSSWFLTCLARPTSSDSVRPRVP